MENVHYLNIAIERNDWSNFSPIVTDDQRIEFINGVCVVTDEACIEDKYVLH